MNEQSIFTAKARRTQSLETKIQPQMNDHRRRLKSDLIAFYPHLVRRRFYSSRRLLISNLAESKALATAGPSAVEFWFLTFVSFVSLADVALAQLIIFFVCRAKSALW
jgi:hypothetical protein